MAEELEAVQRRGMLGILMLVVPTVSIVAVGIAYAVLVSYGAAGRPATGPIVTVDLASCPDARALVVARAEAMGLPELEVLDREGGFAIRARFPSEQRVIDSIPATLAAPGTFEVRALDVDGSEIDVPPLATHADVEEVTGYLGFLDAPRVYLQLEREAGERLRDWMTTHTDQGVAYIVDGERVSTRASQPILTDGEIDLTPEGASDLARIDFAASATLTLQHGPLPCAVRIRDVTTAIDTP